MKLVFKHTLLATVLACVGMAATAQTPATPADAPMGRHSRMDRHDPAKMQAFQAKHMAALKESLKLTPAQEPAWANFTTAMQMQPKQGARPARGDMEKLTAPERIDKMREMRAQHAATADKRGEAVKTLYAALSPEQQKTFDARQTRMGKGERHHGGPGSRGEHGGGQRGGAARAPA